MNSIVSKPYYGKFLDCLSGRFVQNTRHRPHFQLSKKFRFQDPNSLIWTVPKHTIVDGASIPQIFWSFIGGPFDGFYINASVIHDYYCEIKSRTHHDTHRNFYYGMLTSGVELWKAKFMYWAVATFGPKWTLLERVNYDLKVNKSGKRLNCKQELSLKEKTTLLTFVDLEDPIVLSAALSKASTVARSLLTTDGQFHDITASGPLAADLDTIANNAEHYYKIFSKKDFVRSPIKLGVLSRWNAVGLNNVKPWERNLLPTLRSAMVLREGSEEIGKAGMPFKLSHNGANLLPAQIDLTVLRSSTFRIK